MKTYKKESLMKYVHLKLPKFQILSQKDLVNTFKHFGVADIFDRKTSDFQVMTNHTGFIGNLIHISHIVIDEVGAPTNAATDAMVEKTLSEADEFYVTRPFMFLVSSFRTHNVIVSAIVTNPNYN
ncbi:Serpin B7 [Thelohanellus kitauei]|uniref:Serpin B7 n=1 Tax=Thelohanellus kitauei TaxID=669202 RepID=A0A0C2MMR4_THEKT|nr:Serpin B7 [Thelohanellus kitauei]